MFDSKGYRAYLRFIYDEIKVLNEEMQLFCLILRHSHLIGLIHRHEDMII